MTVLPSFLPSHHQVHDYLDVVKHPMDLSTMRQKAQTHQYRDVDQFASDFELMIENCLVYNAKETIFYRTAVKLRDQVREAPME